MEYFGLKLGQDLGNRAAHPYQKFRGVPPPPPPRGSAAFVANSWIIGPSTGLRCSVFFLNHSHTASFTSEYCEVRLRFFALENPPLLSYKSLLFQNVTYLCFSTTEFLSKFAYFCQSFAILVFFYDLKTYF